MKDADRALEIAKRILDQSYRDPDDNISVLARQLIRTREKLEALWHFNCCPYDHCERCIRDAPIIKSMDKFLGNEGPDGLSIHEIRDNATT